MWTLIGMIGLLIFHPIVLVIGPSVVIGFYLIRWAVRALLAPPRTPFSASSLPLPRRVVVTPGMSGVDYETAVARSLSANGWKASTTKGSGDHGLDVMAESGGRSVAIQCKMHSKPVGNRAVQEAYAAKGIYGATHAAVVSSNGFTRSAQAEAHILGVVLIHHDDLPNLGSRLSRSQPTILMPPASNPSSPATPKVEPCQEKFRPQFTVEKAAPDLRALAAEQRKKIEASRGAR